MEICLYRDKYHVRIREKSAKKNKIWDMPHSRTSTYDGIMRAQNSDVTASFRLRLLCFHVRARWRWVIFLSHFVASYFSVCTDHELRLWGKIRSFVLPYPLLGFTALYQPYLRPRNEIHIFYACVYTHARARAHTQGKIWRNASKRIARSKKSKTRYT